MRFSDGPETCFWLQIFGYQDRYDVIDEKNIGASQHHNSSPDFF